MNEPRVDTRQELDPVIVPAVRQDAPVLSTISTQTFMESHGHRAPEETIREYVSAKFSEAAISQELQQQDTLYHLIFVYGKAAGYSKIVLNSHHHNIPIMNVTRLERLYILEEFYNLNIGKELFRFNLALSRNHHQHGMWLFVWEKNQRGIRFYEKNNFKIVGSYNFKLSETHSNPNHQMFLEYSAVKARPIKKALLSAKLL